MCVVNRRTRSNERAIRSLPRDARTLAAAWFALHAGEISLSVAQGSLPDLHGLAKPRLLVLAMSRRVRTRGRNRLSFKVQRYFEKRSNRALSRNGAPKATPT